MQKHSKEINNSTIFLSKFFKFALHIMAHDKPDNNSIQLYVFMLLYDGFKAEFISEENSVKSS
jgi:hypothetical protein